MSAASRAEAATSPDRWDRALLALVPFGAVMLACVSTSVKALADAQPDVVLYFRDAAALLSGKLPYAGFKFEYPPLALVPMALPYAAWPVGAPSLLDYQWLFAFQNAVLASLCAVMVWWLAARPGSGASPFRSLALWALIAVVEAPVLAWRFDIAAVALALLGLVLFVSGRPGLAGASLAIGSLVKVYPAAIVPVLLAWLIVRGDRRAALRLLAGAFVAGGVVLGVVVLAVGPGPVRQFLTYQQDRLVQIESVMSSGLLFLHVLVNEGVSVEYGFQSIQVVGTGTDQFLAIQDVVMVVALVGIGLLAWRRFRSERRTDGEASISTLLVYTAAAILGILVTNKVFSAQYLLWLLPFGCLLPRRAAGVLVVVAILSIVVFPLSYAELFRLETPAILTLVARNALLLGLLGWLLVRFRPLPVAATAADASTVTAGPDRGTPATATRSAPESAPGSSYPRTSAVGRRGWVPPSRMSPPGP